MTKNFLKKKIETIFWKNDETIFWKIDEKNDKNNNKWNDENDDNKWNVENEVIYEEKNGENENM